MRVVYGGQFSLIMPERLPCGKPRAGSWTSRSTVITDQCSDWQATACVCRGRAWLMGQMALGRGDALQDACMLTTGCGVLQYVLLFFIYFFLH